MIAGDGADLTFEAYFPKGHPRNEPGRTVGSFEECVATLLDWSNEGRSIYVRVNEGGPKKLDITAIRAVSIEFDAPEARSQPVPTRWHLEPSALVVRGDSVHAHWLVSQCAVAQFDDCQRRGQEFYGSDPSALGAQRIWRVPGFPHPLFPDQEVELRVGAGGSYSVEEFMDGLPTLALEVHTPVRSTQGGSGDPVTSNQLRTILSFIDPTLDEEYARWVGIAKALWCGQIFVIGEEPDWMSLTDD